MERWNPYQAPADSRRRSAESPELPLLPEAHWASLNVRVAHVDRSWWQRRVLVAGAVEADIRYDPRGSGERVFVDEQLVVTTSIWRVEIVQPHVDFLLRAGDFQVPASIDVRVSALQFFRITRFRLTVAGHVLLDE